MDFIATLTAVVGIAEVIITATKEKVKEKIKPVIWSMGVLLVCSLGGVAFDIAFNSPIIDFKYILECIGLVVISVLAPMCSYEEVLEIAKKIIEALKPVMKK